MAEGADGEEEIQFLRTVSDAFSFFMDNNFFFLNQSLFNSHISIKILTTLALLDVFVLHMTLRLTRPFGFVYRHCYLFINPWILDIVPVYH